MEGGNVLIVGAGAAGLAAAGEISRAGYHVLVLEGRERLGGRIHTIYPKSSPVPIELGAEFLHGDRNVTWEMASAWDDFETTEVPDRHWEFRKGKLRENPRFWEELESVMEQFQGAPRDESFASFMRHVCGVPVHARSLARDYVEGFHAARTDEIGVVALAEAEEAGAKSNGQRQFHVREGYKSLIDGVVNRFQPGRVSIHLNTPVSAIHWRSGSVEVAGADKLFTGRAVVISLPLGVLQQDGLTFDPPLPDKRQAAMALRMGNITKLTLVFERPIWPAHVSGFVHVHHGAFPTWWIDERAPVLTGWAGGPKADALSETTDAALSNAAMDELAKVFDLNQKKVERAMRDHFRHDWARDPYAGGAYSYTPAGKQDAVDCLGEPVEDTLFFAGEALAPPGEQGTVHGALASGRRAASRVCSVLSGH